ncbi:hypothetical protein [Nitrosomonas communis]|uniref:hypothetical protein n=1 Tax=Nitrosomonas communis TaxID=44574 RepID=UPI003D2BB45C
MTELARDSGAKVLEIPHIIFDAFHPDICYAEKNQQKNSPKYITTPKLVYGHLIIGSSLLTLQNF